MTTEKWRRRRGATGNVAVVRREAAVTSGEPGERESDTEQREKIHVRTEPLTSLQAPNTTHLFATSGSQLIRLDQSEGKPCQPENVD